MQSLSRDGLKWTWEEKEKLRQIYQDEGLEKCIETFDRKESAIKSKIWQMGIQKRKNYDCAKSEIYIPNLTKVEKDTLIDIYPHIDTENCVEVLQKTKSMISNSAFNLGLRKSDKWKQDKYKYIREFNKDKKGITWTQFCAIRSRSMKKYKNFNLTEQEIKNLLISQDYKCALSKRNISFNKEKIDNKNIFLASIDRIDSGQGYTIDNIQIVTKEINIAKNSLSQEDFLQMCYDITLENMGK